MYKAHINGEKVQSCRDHCLNAANYAKKSVEEVGIGNIAYLCGVLHDAGKCTEEFNNYIEAATSGANVEKGSVIHTFTGVGMILSQYHSQYNDNINNNAYRNLTAELIAIAIGSHHGLFDVYNSECKSGFDHRLKKQPDYDKKAAVNYYNECVSKTDIDALFRKSIQEIEKIYGQISELVCNTPDTDQIEEMLFYLGILERLLLSALIEGDRRDTAEFMSDAGVRFMDVRSVDLTDIWEKAQEHLLKKLDMLPQVTKLQCARRELSDYCDAFAEKPCGIYRLNLPTGAGKTLSSLRFALTHAKKYNKKHIFFVIPLLSILDQNASVIRDAVGNDEVILEHHSNVVLEDLSEEENLRRARLIDTWDSPIIITTLVQLLTTMFDGKTSAIRRFHSLADSIVVIDEVQSVPTKMMSLFNMTLNFFSKVCNTTFLLCSATQPLFELNNHKLQVNLDEVIPEDKLLSYKKIFKRTNVQYIGELSDGDIIDKAKEYYNSGKSVLIVCNTKKEAYELFSQLRAFTDCCIHLSTSMCMAHRKQVVSEMTQKLGDGESLICVSTQLIEAGVDVSFGAVIRLSAGIDNVAQAAGRGNRNGESDQLAPVGIAYLKGENLSKLKEIKQAQEITGELIAEYKNRPNDFENDLISDASVKYYYETLSRKLNSEVHSTEFCIEGDTLWNFLSCNTNYAENASQDILLRQAFKTAGEKFEVFDNSQVSVIVPYKAGKDIINDILTDRFVVDVAWSKKLLKDAKEYIVNLYEYQMKKLKECGAIYSDKNKTVLILNPEYYDEKLGVITEKGENENWNTLIL